MNHKIEKFDDATNFQLRKLYLETLARPVSYDNGKTTRSRVRHHENWIRIQPHGRNGWGATKGVFANFKDSLDITTKPNVWVWSDLHFGHKNIIRFSDRPFVDTQTMNDQLIENFNSVVQPEDVSIWVGDVAFLPDPLANEYLHRCNGYKILVVGNHDFSKRNLKKLHFDETHVVYNLRIDDRVVAFTHYPMDNVPTGWFNVHGHIHVGSNPLKSTRHFNVNCEFHNYVPLNLNAVADKIDELSQFPDKISEFDYTEYD